MKEAEDRARKKELQKLQDEEREKLKDLQAELRVLENELIERENDGGGERRGGI